MFSRVKFYESLLLFDKYKGSLNNFWVIIDFKMVLIVSIFSCLM